MSAKGGYASPIGGYFGTKFRVFTSKSLFASSFSLFSAKCLAIDLSSTTRVVLWVSLGRLFPLFLLISEITAISVAKISPQLETRKVEFKGVPCPYLACPTKKEETVTVLTVWAVMPDLVMTAAPVKLNPPLFSDNSISRFQSCNLLSISVRAEMIA